MKREHLGVCIRTAKWIARKLIISRWTEEHWKIMRWTAIINSLLLLRFHWFLVLLSNKSTVNSIAKRLSLCLRPNDVKRKLKKNPLNFLISSLYFYVLARIWNVSFWIIQFDHLETVKMKRNKITETEHVSHRFVYYVIYIKLFMNQWNDWSN